MTRPGDRLRRLASCVASEEAKRRLIDPVIADLQFEHADALGRGQPWRARYVHARGLLACASALVSAWLASDAAVPRLIAWSIGVTVALTTVQMWMVWRFVRVRLDAHDGWLAFLYLIPQALGPVIPVAIPCAAAFVLRSTSPTARLRRSTTALAFACSAWRSSGTRCHGSAAGWAPQPHSLASSATSFCMDC